MSNQEHTRLFIKWVWVGQTPKFIKLKIMELNQTQNNIYNIFWINQVGLD